MSVHTSRFLFAAALCAGAFAQTPPPPAAKPAPPPATKPAPPPATKPATPPPQAALEKDSELKVKVGADLRVRQEIMHNVPGLPGAPGAMMPRAYREAQNHMRFRVRPWMRLDYEDFGLYARLVDEVREHFVENGVKRKYRAYNFPDELALDNLYFEGRGLFDGFFDFRIGRQDLFDGRHSVMKLDRIMLDGAPYVGSRSCYADMARFIFHTSDDSTLDAFALYDNGRNIYRYGNRRSRGRPMNAIHPGDGPGMDEWGGGLVWNDVTLDGHLPYQLYTVHKHNEAYTSARGVRVEDKQITAFGVHLMPQLNDNLSFDLDAAKQFWNFRWITIPELKRGPTWLCIPLCGLTSSIYLLYSNGILLAALIIGSTNLPQRIAGRILSAVRESDTVSVLLRSLFYAAVFLLSVASLVGASYNPFLYFRF